MKLVMQDNFNEVQQIINETAFNISSAEKVDVNQVESDDVVTHLSDDDKATLIMKYTKGADLYELLEFVDEDTLQKFTEAMLFPTDKFKQLKLMNSMRSQILAGCDTWLSIMIDPIIDKNKIWGWD